MVAAAAAAAVNTTLELATAAAAPMAPRGGPGAAQPQQLDLEGAVVLPGSLATCKREGEEDGAAAPGFEPPARQQVPTIASSIVH